VKRFECLAAVAALKSIATESQGGEISHPPPTAWPTCMEMIKEIFVPFLSQSQFLPAVSPIRAHERSHDAYRVRTARPLRANSAPCGKTGLRTIQLSRKIPTPSSTSSRRVGSSYMPPEPDLALPFLPLDLSSAYQHMPSSLYCTSALYALSPRNCSKLRPCTLNARPSAPSSGIRMAPEDALPFTRLEQSTSILQHYNLGAASQVKPASVLWFGSMTTWTMAG
jgi:hypothetical protein